MKKLNLCLLDQTFDLLVLNPVHVCVNASGIQIGRSQQLFVTQTDAFDAQVRELLIQASNTEQVTCGAQIVVFLVVEKL